MPPENEEEVLLDPPNESDDVTEDVLEETDEWGNPVGTEYDDDGIAIIDDEPEPEEPVTAAAPPPARTPAVPFALAPVLSDEDREYGEALGLTPQVISFLEHLTSKQSAMIQQSYAAANSTVEATLQDASPEYRRMVLPLMNNVLSRMLPAQRADPHAADDALLVVMSDEGRQTGESLMQVMARHMQMRGGTTPANRPPVAVRPAATRAPAPSSAGRGPVVRGRVGTPTASKNIQLVANSLGITVAEAEAMGLK
jgi:hypothetical protein